jgi:hypothetical protein
MKLCRFFILMLISILFVSSSKSQWIPCQGIEGGSCSSIITQDSFLFIDGPGGIYRRQIDDPTWDTACLKGGFNKIRSTGNALFCWGPMVPLYRSIDKGITWESIDLGWDCHDFETVDSVIILDIYSEYFLVSSDNGENWEEIDPSPGSEEIKMIYSQPGILFWFLESIDTLYRSDDYGLSWITYPLTGITEIGDPYLYNDQLWLASGNHFYIYENNLNEWIIQEDTLPGQIYNLGFIEDVGNLCCYTSNGFFRFDVQNSQWVDESLGLENRWCLEGCLLNNTFYLATAAGPFSKTANEQWIPQYDDLFGWEVSQVFAVGSRIYALANGRIYYSDDVSNGFDIMETQGYCSSSQLVVTDSAWYSASNCGFSISVDSGQSWTEYNTGMEGYKFFKIAMSDNYYFAELLLPSNHGLVRSRSDSIAWQSVPNEFSNGYFSDIDVIENVLFVILGSNSGLYKSNDNGTTFEAIPEVGYESSCLFIKNNKIFILRNYKDVLYSEDLGISWQTWISGVDDYAVECMDITDAGETTVLGGYIGPWNPINYLELFTPEFPSGIDIIGNLPDYDWSSIHDVLFQNGSIFACPSSGGLWYRDDLMVGVNDEDKVKPVSSSHLSIYPNPVKDVLNIHSENQFKKCEYQVIDYSGKMMMKGLVEDRSNDISVDVSPLPQGIYLIIVWNDDQFISAKFIKTN